MVTGDEPAEEASELRSEARVSFHGGEHGGADDDLSPGLIAPRFLLGLGRKRVELGS